MAMAVKEKGTVLASNALAKGVERAALEVDRLMGRSAMAPHGRPSTYINIAGGLALMFGPEYVRTSEAVKDVGNLMGGHMVNQVWDYVEEYMAGAPAAGVPTRQVPSGRYAAETPGGAPEFHPPLYGRRVSPEPVIKNHVRYTLE